MSNATLDLCAMCNRIEEGHGSRGPDGSIVKPSPSVKSHQFMSSRNLPPTTFRESISTEWWAAFDAEVEDNEEFFNMPARSMVGSDCLALIKQADTLLASSKNFETSFVESIRKAVVDQVIVWYFG